MRLLSTTSAIATLAGALAFAGSASAAVTIGVPPSVMPGVDPDLGVCNVNPQTLNVCTEGLLQITENTTQFSGTAPSSGVITAWHVRRGPGGAAPITFRILRDLGGNVTLGIASDPRTLAATPDIQSFQARLGIQQGDRIGVDAPAGTPIVTNNEDADPSDVAGFRHEAGTVADGGTRTATVAGMTFAPLIGATLEPDTDADVFGDETQDQCPGVTGVNNGCPPVVVTPPPPPPPPQAAFVSATLSSTGSSVVVKLICPSAGTLDIVATAPDTRKSSRARRGLAVISARRGAPRVVVARRRAIVRQGGPVSVRIKLNKTGRSILRRSGKVLSRAQIGFKPSVAGIGAVNLAKNLAFKKKRKRR